MSRTPSGPASTWPAPRSRAEVLAQREGYRRADFVGTSPSIYLPPDDPELAAPLGDFADVIEALGKLPK